MQYVSGEATLKFKKTGKLSVFFIADNKTASNTVQITVTDKEAEKAKKAEEARLAEEAKQAEEARLAEEAKQAEEAKLAEEAKQAE